MSRRRSKGQLIFNPKVFITEEELATRWRHSLRSVQRWRAAGWGPRAVRIGRRTIYRLADVEEFETSAANEEPNT